jgi:hypothetical protein
MVIDGDQRSAWEDIASCSAVGRPDHLIAVRPEPADAPEALGQTRLTADRTDHIDRTVRLPRPAATRGWSETA